MLEVNVSADALKLASISTLGAWIDEVRVSPAGEVDTSTDSDGACIEVVTVKTEGETVTPAETLGA